MDVSIIITTYNHPRWLERVLWGYRFQTHQRLEVVVADDGSDEATRQTIEAMREKTGLTIRHIWHEDDGFRKCEILNKAILAATHPYLIFTDGDCVPRKDFLEQHIRLSEPNMFLSGGVVRLPQSVSKLISQETIQTGQALDWRWLRQKGLPWSRKAIRLTRNQGIARFLDGITTTRPTFNGHNVSAWKSDIIRVNGFNEEMKYGGLDRESANGWSMQEFKPNRFVIEQFVSISITNVLMQLRRAGVTTIRSARRPPRTSGSGPKKV